jgi:rhodanese-related sulfurtransferase
MASQIKSVSARELKGLLESSSPPVLIDVREPQEREICSIGGALIPLAQVTARRSEIPIDQPVIVYCRSGGRSARAIEELQLQHNYKNLYNLAGGILGWIEEIDPSLTPY